jgi:hypothetical protein
MQQDNSKNLDICDDPVFHIIRHVDNKKFIQHFDRRTARKLHNLYSSPSIIRMIKSRRMRWAGHITRMGEKRNACKILAGKSEEKIDH